MADKSANEATNAAGSDETRLREMKADQLREEAKEAGVSGTSEMRKDDLVNEVVRARRDAPPEEPTETSDDPGAGPDEGQLRTGEQTSKSLRYSQEVTSPDEEPEREGRSLATTHHGVIKRWAEERGGAPATVTGTEHESHLGVLRFDFGGESENLRRVSWDEWFETFDARRLNFIYQETRSDGSQSNFFRLESPEREDG
ncbi:hypothetical protein GCM10009740_39100 [Terrabacter terrae]|uniref:Rho termination factor-like N-terminal domain-containing protein n=1 Tax=Terrabacter terrae TaxID=318434 RepID=A0ABN1ZS77_9MICO